MWLRKQNFISNGDYTQSLSNLPPEGVSLWLESIKAMVPEDVRELVTVELMVELYTYMHPGIALDRKPCQNHNIENALNETAQTPEQTMEEIPAEKPDWQYEQALFEEALIQQIEDYETWEL